MCVSVETRDKRCRCIGEIRLPSFHAQRLHACSHLYATGLHDIKHMRFTYRRLSLRFDRSSPTHDFCYEP